jgi:hypothetical protein
MAKERNPFSPEDTSRLLLLPLARFGHLRCRSPRVVRALVAGCGENQIHDHSSARHLQHSATAVKLDVVRVGDDAKSSLDAPVVGTGEEAGASHLSVPTQK